MAPISGTIVSLFPHAVGIESGAYSILVHLGLETVNLNGKGFTLLKAQGDQVTAGEPVIQWNPAAIESQDKLPVVTPVIAVQGDASALTQARPLGDGHRGGRTAVRDRLIAVVVHRTPKTERKAAPHA